MRKLLNIGFFLMPLVTFGLIAVPYIRAADSNTETLFERRCSMCHPTARPLSKSKTGEEWRQTVMRMKARAGGRISDEEAEMIIKYLTEIRGK